MELDVVLLSRLQFALTIGFHYIFPPITIGLAWLLVLIETKGYKTGEEVYERIGIFFGKLLGITFAVGVATGIVHAPGHCLHRLRILGLQGQGGALGGRLLAAVP